MSTPTVRPCFRLAVPWLYHGTMVWSAYDNIPQHFKPKKHIVWQWLSSLMCEKEQGEKTPGRLPNSMIKTGFSTSRNGCEGLIILQDNQRKLDPVLANILWNFIREDFPTIQGKRVLRKPCHHQSSRTYTCPIPMYGNARHQTKAVIFDGGKCGENCQKIVYQP